MTSSREIVDLTMDSDEEQPVKAKASSVPAWAVSTPTLGSVALKFPAAKPTAKPAAASTSQDQPRRSARDHKSKSTLIWIDGHAVKKANNYSVTEGEYIYHDNDLYDTVSPSQKRRAAAAATAKANKKPKTVQPRKVSPQELARTAHNNAVKASKNDKLGRRRAFLATHAEILKPFVDDAVYQELLLSKPSKEGSIVIDDSIRSTAVAQPKLVNGTLRDYQLSGGLRFLIHHHTRNLGMILGDEMGLGKTLQTIALLCYLKETEKKQGPSLVVVPLSVLSSWMKELEHWAPSLKAFRLHNSSATGQAKGRQAILDNLAEFDVVLTTYEMVKTQHLQSLFQRIHFNYLILDEGHKVKCSETQVAVAVRKIHCEHRLLLTGTPLQNNMVELWSLLELLYPEIFTTKKPFEECFNLTENHVDKGMLSKAQQLLNLFMIRRLKSKVETMLPPKLETLVHCPLSKTQEFLYKAVLLKDLSLLERVDKTLGAGDEDDDGERLSHTHRNLLKNLFMQLRKASQHPWTFDGMQMPDANLQDMIAASGKLAVLDMLLRSLFKKGHKVVLFSQFVSVLRLLEDYCVERGWKYAVFDGSTARAKRDFLVQKFNGFNEEHSPVFIFLMSTKSGGVGLNLQSADTCILYDSDWNPQNDLQAMARVHRIGQKKIVHVYRLITSNSVEQRMVERANKKLLLDRSVNRESHGASKDDANSGGQGVKSMLDDIKFGASSIFGGSASEALPTLDEIEHITNRDRKDSDTLGKLKGGAQQNFAAFDAEKEFTDGQVFQSLDFRKIRQEKERNSVKDMPQTLKGIGHLWQSIQAIEGKKREKKSRLVMVEGAGSGYGKAHVPVLASNNYDLASGESSVFGRELKSNQKKLAAVPSKKTRAFENWSWCQVCLDGGDLVCCPRCPVSLHLQCCGIKRNKEFLSCMHHRCVTCKKNLVEAGGLLYPCAVCPWAYCGDCLPKTNEGFRILGENSRWEDLGFDSTKNAVYIHCSAECERYAKTEYDWKPQAIKRVCPEALDVSYNFGVNECDITAAANEKVSGDKTQATTSNVVDLSGSPGSISEDNTLHSLDRKPAAAEVSSSSSDDEDRKRASFLSCNHCNVGQFYNSSRRLSW